MEQTGWVKAKAARVLGLTPRQIGYALEKYNVPIKKFESASKLMLCRRLPIGWRLRLSDQLLRDGAQRQ